MSHLTAPSSWPYLPRTLRYVAVAAAAAAALGVQPAVAQAGGRTDRISSADATEHMQLKVFGLTSDHKLVHLRIGSSQPPRVVGMIYGLTGHDTALVGIDFRVQGTPASNLAPGMLYGVGNAGGIYTIDTSNAMATMVSQLGVPLSGMSFGVDFNPAANALRIVSDTGQNLSHTIDTNTTTAQTALTFPGRTSFAATGVAYVNNDLDLNTATTLFDIDPTNNVVAIQSPPANGVLGTVGALTVDADAQVGFDIYSTLKNGATVRNHGYASLMMGGTTSLYRINLLTGKASWISDLSLPLVDIALPLDQ